MILVDSRIGVLDVQEEVLEIVRGSFSKHSIWMTYLFSVEHNVYYYTVVSIF